MRSRDERKKAEMRSSVSPSAHSGQDGYHRTDRRDPRTRRGPSIPIAATAVPRGSAQSGFYEVDGRVSPALIAFDLTETSRFSRRALTPLAAQSCLWISTFPGSGMPNRFMRLDRKWQVHALPLSKRRSSILGGTPCWYCYRRLERGFCWNFCSSFTAISNGRRCWVTTFQIVFDATR